MRVTCALLFLAIGAGAQSGRVHVTELGRRILTKCDQVVEASVVKLLPPFRGVSTARLKVTRRFSGYDRSEQILLLFIEDFVAPDAFQATLERSTVTAPKPGKDPEKPRTTTERARGADLRRGTLGVRLAAGEDGIFFLRRQGASYAMVGYVPRRDPLYASKRARLGDVIEIESVRAVDVRAKRARDFYLADLTNRNPWERGNSARELAALAQRYRGLLTQADGRRIAALLFKENEPPIRASLERAVRSIDADLALRYAREAEQQERERNARPLAAEAALLAKTLDPDVRAADVVRVARRYGRAATELLSRHLADDAAIVRERAAQSLAEVGGPSARPPLREALAKETDMNAATAMIYAAGILGDPAAVPVLRGRLKTPEFERPALHALARIGTKDARKALEAHRAGAGPASAELIDSLLREEFPG